MEIQQLFDPDSSTYTYLVWDARSGEAALIDPVRQQVGRDIRLVRQLGLKLKYTLETHIHADHITGAGAIRNILNSIVLVHENSRSKCADVLVKDGDFVPLGTQKVYIMHTPGHTDNDVCYLIDGAVFTGDTLFSDSEVKAHEAELNGQAHIFRSSEAFGLLEAACQKKDPDCEVKVDRLLAVVDEAGKRHLFAEVEISRGSQGRADYHYRHDK